jgi:pimeloyl-ACP methyl ester carboxylesterase
LSKHIYIFSGLGADERAFQQLDLDAYHVTHIQWIKPAAEESIEVYAGRLIEQVITPKPILVGLSFGGLMAIEASKHISTEKIVLISSVKTMKEIPLPYRIMGKIGLQKIFPLQFLKHSNAITNFIFGAHSNEDKELLKPMIENTDMQFLKWAMDKVATWKNGFNPGNITHIHGTADKVLPYRNVKCDYTIDKGEHMMVLNRAGEVNEILHNILK